MPNLKSLVPDPPFARERPSLALLVAVTMTGTAALHIFVPALPAVARDLGASATTVQLTITLYLIGLAGGQLIYGPISDAFGRRQILIGSMAAYLLGFLLAIPATNVAWLIAARFLQSVGACGALVLGRAMVRDVSTSEDAAKKLAVLVTCMTLTPSLAPGLGGLIEAWLGWRAIFAVLGAIVFVLLAVVVLTLRETKRTVTGTIAVGTVVASYGRLLRSAKFRHYLVAGSCAGTSLYAFLATAPFLYIDLLHRNAQEVGLYCVIVSLGMAVGASCVRVLVGRMEVRRGARLGNFISMLATFGLFAAHFTGTLGIVTLTGSMIVYAFGIGISGPNTVAGAMNVDPDAAGAASSLYGFSQMAFGALFTLAIGLWHAPSALPLAVVLLAACSFAAISLQRV